MATDGSALAQRQTVDALISAFNTMDVDAIFRLRSPECIRTIRPHSLGHPTQTGAETQRSLMLLRTVFQNFNLKVDDIVEDFPRHKTCIWLTARADTAVGEYVNEYVWNLTFSPDGKQILAWTEFVDAGMKDFFPKLKEAYTELAKKKQEQQQERKAEDAEAKAKASEAIVAEEGQVTNGQ